MSISLIIPTLNRTDDLRRALASIEANTIHPSEILILEQGDIERTREVSDTFADTLSVRTLFFPEKSLTRARNYGVTESRGDIVMFMDDDVELEDNYLAVLTTYVDAHPEVLGVVGKDLAHLRKWTIAAVSMGILRTLFCSASFFGPSRIRRSGYNILQNVSDTEQVVEWLSGCAFAVRKKVFRHGFSFKKEFIRWSLGEDAYFSYQIHKKYPGTLRYLPTLEFRHNSSPVARLTKHEIIRMKIIYKYIFWKQEVYQGSFLNLLCYLWAQVGMSLMDIGIAHCNWRAMGTIIESYLYVFLNFKYIDADTIDYNKFILYG